MAGRLNGKVALITGAASGVGRATTALFVSEGARVAALDVDADALQALAAEFDGLVAVDCDVSDGAAVEAGVAETARTLGTVNVVINNAGIALRRPGPWDESQDGSLADVTEEVFDRVMGVNTKGQFLVCKYTLPHLIAAGGGSIVNLASVGGVFLGAAINAYCVSKAAVAGLTRAVALTYGPQRIRANCLCPALTATPQVEALFKDEEFMANYLSATPLRRFAMPLEVAHAALFLASDESSYVNGAVIAVDGGSVIRTPG